MATIQGDHLASRLQLHADGWIGLGALPARHEASRTYDDQFFTDDRLAVFFDGDLLNRASIAAASRISLETAREMSTPELIARCFEHRGPVLFEELDGIYRIIVWDFVDKKLYIANDRFAMMPMFYYQEGERIFFGSEIKFILKGIEALPGINVQAIADFLAFGSILNENTFFSGIRFVPREACVEIAEDSIKEIPYSNRLDFTQSPGITQFEDACAHIRNAVMTGIRAYSGDHSAAVFLSGGISSRFLAAAEKRLRGHLQTFTFGADFSDDMEIAREVAIALNAEHETRVLAPERYIESFQRAVWLSDGLLDGGAGGLLSMMAGSENEIPLYLYGLNFLNAPFYNAEFAYWRRRKHDVRFKTWLAERIFGKIYRADDEYLPAGAIIRDEVNGPLFDPDAQLRHLAASTDLFEEYPGKALHYLQFAYRQPYRQALQFQALNHYAPVKAPYFTFQYLDTVLKLPESYLSRDQKLFRHLLAEFAPELLNIRWQNTMLPLNASQKEEYFWRILKFLNDHFRFYRGRPLENNPLVRQPIFDFQKALESDAGFQQAVRYLLFDLLPDELINRYTVQKLFRYAITYRLDVSEFLSRIMTITLWYQYFVLKNDPFDMMVRKRSGGLQKVF
ncbi:MAG: asparagine synthase-related protein [candidate division KSB1 bacterium]|nr:asparagine synthase-related protein [candidate division KSB1 bacterium]